MQPHNPPHNPHIEDDRRKRIERLLHDWSGVDPHDDEAFAVDALLKRYEVLQGGVSLALAGTLADEPAYTPHGALAAWAREIRRIGYERRDEDLQQVADEMNAALPPDLRF